MTQPVHCERCGAVADVDWCDVSTFAEGPGSVLLMGQSSCTTPGCVDEAGSSAVLPPDKPGELTRADRLWLRYFERRFQEFKRVNAAFQRMLEEVR